MTDITTTLARIRVPLGFVFGAAIVWLAHPTFGTLAIGVAIAAPGEVIRVWASGHLEKGREVTSSGPYRFMRHPLYTGSALIGAGLAVASARWSVAAIVSAYLLSTIVSAIRHEEENMRAAFGAQYDAYLSSWPQVVRRSFSAERARRNKEHDTIVGLLVVTAVFAFKASRHL